METFDQFNELPKGPGVWKASLEYGLYAGLVIILFSLFNLIPGVPNSPWFVGMVSWSIYTAVVVLALRHFRDKKNYNQMSYGQGVGLGALTGLNGGFIAAVVVFAVYSLRPELTDNALQLAIESMDTGSMSDEQLNVALKAVQFMINPPMMAIMTLFGSVFNFTLVALIASAFIKKD